jgi:excisionase family DNA binding protein
METQDWLTVKEAAERLSVTERTVTKHINEGKLEAIKEGREWRIHHDLRPPYEETQNSKEGTQNSMESEKGAEDTNIQILKKSLEMLQNTVGVLQNTLGTLEEQLREKDSQIQNLQMLLAMEKQEKKALTENRMLIADITNQRLPWWRKLFGRTRAQTVPM